MPLVTNAVDHARPRCKGPNHARETRLAEVIAHVLDPSQVDTATHFAGPHMSASRPLEAAS